MSAMIWLLNFLFSGPLTRKQSLLQSILRDQSKSPTTTNVCSSSCYHLTVQWVIDLMNTLNTFSFRRKLSKSVIYLFLWRQMSCRIFMSQKSISLFPKINIRTKWSISRMSSCSFNAMWELSIFDRYKWENDSVNFIYIYGGASLMPCQFWAKFNGALLLKILWKEICDFLLFF